MKTRYPADRTVSVWVGTFAGEDDFDTFVDRTLAPALHLPTHIADICEVTFETLAKPVGELLDGFSGCRSFVAAAEAAAAAKGISSANAALVCYYLACDDSVQPWSEMSFLGSFQGSDNE